MAHYSHYVLFQVNDKVYSRWVPYLGGMLSALCFNHYKTSLTAITIARPILTNSVSVVSVLLLLLTTWLGNGGMPLDERSGLLWTWLDHPSDLQHTLLVAAQSVFGLALAVVVTLCFIGRLEMLRRVLSWPVWTPVARLSYSVYLLQFFVLTPSYTYFPSNQSDSVGMILGKYFGLCWITIVVTFAMAFFMFVLVEQPFMQLR